MTDDDFTKLGPDGFESLSQALALCVLGAGLTVFGDGPDGGREATFDGLLPFPSEADQWNGYGVVQAKYKSSAGSARQNGTWFLGRVKTELADWTNPAKRRVAQGRVPQYLIFTTNISLSSTPGTGCKDAFEELMATYRDRLGLLGWRVWDADQLSRLLDGFPGVRASFAGLITPNEVLAQIMKQLTTPISVNVSPPAVTVHVSQPSALIKPGEPGNETPFQGTYDAVGGADVLGRALGDVEKINDGYVQRFDGGPTRVGRVLCAPAGYPVVAMDHMVWDQLEAIGGRNAGVRCIGYPIAPPNGRPYIGEDWTEILLIGGMWGRRRNDERRSRLVRDADGQPVWQPEIVFDDEASRTSDWRVDSHPDTKMDLRLAVSGNILLQASDLEVTEQGRARMLEAITTTGLDAFLDNLGKRYGCQPSAGWQEIDDSYRNTGRAAAYERLQVGATGRTAIRAGLQLNLPMSHSIEAMVLAEVRIDFDALRPSDLAEPVTSVPPDLAVCLDELQAFLRSGWQATTTCLLLAATAAPARIIPAGAPRIEFYIQNERPEHSGDPRQRRLLEMVDLSGFGRARIRSPRSLAVGITTPVCLPTDQVARQADRALEHLARSFGFTSPTLPDPQKPATQGKEGR